MPTGEVKFPMKNHALPDMRDEECKHGVDGKWFVYTGRIPSTGPRICPMCGARYEEVYPEE